MKKNQRKILFFFLLIFYFLIFQIHQNQFELLFPLVLLLFVLSHFILKSINNKEFYFLFSSIVLIGFFFSPNLSNDYYRFLWDGSLMHYGLNPYDFTPEYILENHKIKDNNLKELYIFLDPLSKKNYSCYPIISQFYFYISTFSTNIFFNLVCLKIFLLSTIILGIYFLNKILLLLNKSKQIFFWFFLHPLLIIEGIQNVHFESIMLSFLMPFLYYLLKKKWLLASLFLSLAIQIKLIPILLLFFVLRFIGIWNWLKINVFTFAFISIISLFLIQNNNYLNFLSSVFLYFNNFEFNSFIFHWTINYSEWRYGYNRVLTFGPFLARISATHIIILAWYGTDFTFEKMCSRIVVAFSIYYFLSSTVHPWYLLLPLFFSKFTSYTYMQIWSFLVFLSYYSYENQHNDFLLRFLHTIEYFVVFFFFVTEVIFKKKLLKSKIM
ncbi:MAG: hypothetical protein HYU67_02175 [Flavobacteriia bacterium]|nr:hypothetical protein [Flavobacteriia bacterium]